MKHKELSRWLKLLLILSGIVVVFLAFILVPNVAKEMAATRLRYSHLQTPFNIFVWISTVPFIASLFMGWSICTEVGSDNSFSVKNAKSLTYISRFSLIEVIYYFIGIVLLLIFDLLHPPIIIAMAVVIFISFAMAVITAALSHLVNKAAAIKDENDLTV